MIAVVDNDPEKEGRTVEELTGAPSRIRVQAILGGPPIGKAQVVVFSTKSRFADLVPDVIRAVEFGLDVVTTSEEMALPESTNPEASRELDTLAKAKGVTIVGVGVNPGFIMDWVPSMVASASNDPTSIHVVRSVDVSKRRRQLQAKTGVGLTRARFEKEVSEGRLGHVGLVESANLVARSLGSPLEGLKQGVFPVLGSDDYVMGVRQFVEGNAGNCVIRLDLEMSITSADFDVIDVKGDPNIKLRFEKGVFGDSATVALVVNAVERVGNAPSGLITVLDLPLSRA